MGKSSFGNRGTTLGCTSLTTSAFSLGVTLLLDIAQNAFMTDCLGLGITTGFTVNLLVKC